MPDYIVHKPVNLDKVKKARRLVLEQPGYLQNNYDAEAKYDGCCAVMKVFPDGGTETLSRTGEPVYALARVERNLEYLLKDRVKGYGGLVLLGEAWAPDTPFNELSGTFRRRAENDEMQFVVFDVLTLAEFEAGTSPVAKAARRERLAGIMSTPGVWKRAYVWPAGSYGDPQTLCNQTVAMGGFDGLVLTDPLGSWYKGLGTGGEQVKIKRTLMFSLRVLEVNTVKGEKTGRDVYKLVVSYMGRALGVGSGLPHDRDSVPNVGDIVEVEAMDYSADGLLREPRYKGIRHDVLVPDA